LYSENPEQVAQKFGELVSNLHLDLEQTGVFIARYLPHLTYNRLIAIIEMAQDEKQSVLLEHEKWNQNGLW
jgi:hypothetical protein